MSNFPWLQFAFAASVFFSAGERVVAQALGVNPSAAASDVGNRAQPTPLLPLRMFETRAPPIPPPRRLKWLSRPQDLQEQLTWLRPSRGSAPQHRPVAPLWFSAPGSTNRYRAGLMLRQKWSDRSKRLRALGSTVSSLKSARLRTRSNSACWRRSKKLSKLQTRKPRQQSAQVKGAAPWCRRTPRIHAIVLYRILVNRELATSGSRIRGRPETEVRPTAAPSVLPGRCRAP